MCWILTFSDCRDSIHRGIDFPEKGIWDLESPGQHATYFAGRSDARDEKNEALMHQSTYVWPHAFTWMDASAEAFLSRFGANHIHAVPGDITAELAAVCRFLEIDLERLDV